MTAKPDPRRDGATESHEPENPETAGEAEARPDGGTESAAANEAGAEPVDLGAVGTDDPVAVLEAEKAELKDQLLRAFAEMENVRRRTQRDKDETARFAISAFARDLLGVADNLRRALDAIPDARIEEDHELRSLAEGVELVERDLLQAFERHGVTRISPLGEKFDHNVHQAMFEVESADAAPGTVVQLMAPGYLIHGRLLRPAMVGVAEAPAAAATPEGDGPGSDGTDGERSEGGSKEPASDT